MKTKKPLVTQHKPNPQLFKNSQVGIQSFQPFKHKKNGKPYTDLDYMYLLGKTCIEKDKNGELYFYDKNTVAVAKEIVKGRDELNMSNKDLQKYLCDCLDLSELN